MIAQRSLGMHTPSVAFVAPAGGPRAASRARSRIASAMAADRGEVNHRECLQVVAFGRRRQPILHNTRTGEARLMDATQRLYFTDGGMGYLSGPAGSDGDGSAPVWVNDLFRFSVFVRAAGDQTEYDLYDSEEDTYTAMTRLEWSGQCVPVSVGAGAGKFEGEAYGFVVPKALSDIPRACKYFIVAPWVLHRLLGAHRAPHNRWLGRFIGNTLVEWLSVFGFQEARQHTRPSKKSQQEVFRQRGLPTPPDLLVSIEEEFSMTGHAMFLWVCTWASGCQLKGWDDRAQNLIDNATSLIHTLVDCLVDAGSYEVCVGEGCRCGIFPIAPFLCAGRVTQHTKVRLNYHVAIVFLFVFFRLVWRRLHGCGGEQTCIFCLWVWPPLPRE